MLYGLSSLNEFSDGGDLVQVFSALNLRKLSADFMTGHIRRIIGLLQMNAYMCWGEPIRISIAWASRTTMESILRKRIATIH
jgi:hypothetical protein